MLVVLVASVLLVEQQGHAEADENDGHIRQGLAKLVLQHRGET